MPDIRDVTLSDIFAKDAQTVIPATPIPGIAYRNPSVGDLAAGQAYDRVFDSARWNETMFQITTLIRACEQYGGIPWSPRVEHYPVGSRVLGSDGKSYQATVASDASAPKDPVSNPDYWETASGLLVIRAFTEPGVHTYTPTPGTRCIKVIVTGGGGGSGASAEGEYEHRGSGGGAGGTAIGWIDLEGISSISATVGAGGNGTEDAANNGQNGESSSFGTYLSATGGNAGGADGGGAGGKGFGDIEIEGGTGSDATTVKGSGDGGSSFWGGGGRAGSGYGAPTQNLVGGAPGAGVGGRYVRGDKGKSGIVYIEEYA